MANLTEVLIANTIDCFQSFPLQDLDEEWFNDLWINHFSTLEDYPASGNDIFREDLFQLISNAVDICEEWCEKSVKFNETDPENDTLAPSEEVLWTVLVDNNIDIKYILGFIHAVCNKGIKPCAIRFQQENALKCAKLYFTLLQIPGNSAYNVYYPSLLQLAFDCIKFPKEKVPGKKRPPTSAYRNEIMSKKKRTKRNDTLSDSFEEPIGTDDFVAPDRREFREQKCDDSLLKCFIDVLKSVIPLFQTFSLSGNCELIEHITRKLSECVAVESRPIRLNFSRNVDEILTREFQRQNGLPNVVVALGYYAYLNLCQTLHGDVNEIYRLCLQSLCDHILCSNAYKMQPNQLILKKHLVVRDNALAFVCYNLKKHRNYSVEVSRILVQRLCMRCYDKTDFRSKVASAVEKILTFFPLKAYVEMIEWFVRFVTLKPQDRMIALEIFAILIMAPEREITPEITKSWSVYTTHIPLVCSVIEQCDNKTTTVAAKALSVLTSTLKRVMEVISDFRVRQRDFSFDDEDEDAEGNETHTENEDDGAKQGNAECVEEDEVNGDNGDKGDEANKAEETEAENADTTAPSDKNKSEYQPCISQFELCSVEQLIELLLFHAMDEKHVHVRKSALQAIERLLCLDETYLTEKFLRYLSRATLDPNVTVQKSSMSSLTILLHKYYDNSLVQKVWMRNVLRAVLNVEKSVVNKGLEQMEQLFLLNYGNSSSMKHCSWTMLTEIACGSCTYLLRYLNKAYSIWKTEDKLNPSLSHLLEAQLGTEYDDAAWMLLSILSSQIEIKNVTGFINRWKQSSEASVPISTQQRMLEVLGNTCKHMKADQLQDLKTSLEKPLCNFSCHFQLTYRMFETLYKVYGVKCKQKNEHDKLMKAFAAELIQPAEKLLSKLIIDTNPFGEYSNDQICQYLQMVGDLAVLVPTSIPKSMFRILQGIIAITSTSENGVNYGASSSTAITAKVWRLCPKVQGMALTALGKLCAVNEEYVQKCIPIFVKELASKSFVVRLNIVTALTDLCVRYTLMVDSYIPSISVYLKDANVNVRQQTLALISRLLQEDYIKLKDSLLYHLLSVLVDDNEDMRYMAEYYLCDLLMKKQQNIFIQQFAKIIFYFNASSPFHSLQFDPQKQETQLFELKGRKNFEKRMIIYKFMTLQTPVVKRFLIFVKLSNDILNAVATEIKCIDDDTEAVIKDTLAVLSLDEFKPTHSHSNASDDNDEAETTDSGRWKAMYRNTIIATIVPTAVALRKMLSELKSPLTPYVLQFLAEICKDYKNEVKDVFATNKAVADEIAYITKKYEKELEKKKRSNNSGVEETEDGLQPPKSSSPAVIPPRTDATTSEDEQIHQFLISNGIDTTRRPVVLLERISVPYREPVNAAELFSENGLWNPNRTNVNENSRHRRRTRRHHKVTNGQISLAETPILPRESNERNTAMGNITVCDIGNADWDDGRRSMNSSRASTRRSRNTKR